MPRVGCSLATCLQGRTKPRMENTGRTRHGVHGFRGTSYKKDWNRSWDLLQGLWGSGLKVGVESTKTAGSLKSIYGLL